MFAMGLVPPTPRVPGCVKTLRGISAPQILRLVVTRRAKKRRNSFSARRYDQIRYRFHTAWKAGVADTEVVGVVDGGLGAQGAVFLVVLLDPCVLVIDVQGRGDVLRAWH